MPAVPAAYFRLPLFLLFIVVTLCIVTVIDPPAGRFNWFLEVSPGLSGIFILILLYKRLPMSHMVYIFVFLHMIILIYGGYYTYAKAPLGYWAMDVFGFERNHYDRIGHVALGIFPGFIIREVLLRKTPLVWGGWLYFITISIVLAVAAFWELLEWWITLLVASDVGTAFLGSQGDVWDAQWDMFLALAGAMIVLPLLAGMHDRSLAKLTRIEMY